jgi:replication fork clamp-binding protein CrfC
MNTIQQTQNSSIDYQILEAMKRIQKQELKNKVLDFVYSLILREKNEPITKQEKQGREAFFGIAKGKIWMSDDFDEPLEEFKEYM